MAFKKGNSEGGRTKGAVNKITQTSRELFLETLEGQSEHIAEAFEKVRLKDPKEYLDLFAKYAQYFVPKKTENSDKVTLTVKEFNIKEALGFEKTEE